MKAGEGLGEASKCNKCDLREERAVKAGEGQGPRGWVRPVSVTSVT